MSQAPIYLSWSSGKDSAYALYRLRQEGYRVEGLLTTISAQYGRVAIHGVRESLLDLQAESLALPLTKIYLPTPCSNEIYESELARTLETLRDRGIRHIAFGDLFLADLRAYRESTLGKLGFACLFPLWQNETSLLAQTMVSSGLKAKVTCLDPRKLTRNFAGRDFDRSFLQTLPTSVDPCGENGEFHTFAYDGPMFSRPVRIFPGEIVEREGFVFADFMEEATLPL